jgi:hypothetical protein
VVGPDDHLKSLNRQVDKKKTSFKFLLTYCTRLNRKHIFLKKKWKVKVINTITDKENVITQDKRTEQK